MSDFGMSTTLEAMVREVIEYTLDRKDMCKTEIYKAVMSGEDFVTACVEDVDIEISNKRDLEEEMEEMRDALDEIGSLAARF